MHHCDGLCERLFLLIATTILLQHGTHHHRRISFPRHRQVVHSGLSIGESLAATSEPVTASQLYRLVKKEKESIKNVAEHGTAQFLKRDISTDTTSDVSSLSPMASPAKRQRKRSKKATAGFSSIAALAIEDGVKNAISSSMSNIADEAAGRIRRSSRKSDGSITSASSNSMTLRPTPRLTQHQKNWTSVVNKQSKVHTENRYKAALKEGTTLYVEGRDSGNKQSYDKIAQKMNAKYDLQGTKRMVTKTTLHTYVNNANIGTSPMKRGPAPSLPPQFLELLNCHVSMTQLEGKEETKPRMLKALIGAALKGTEFESMSEDYIYTLFRQRYPDTVCPSKAMEMEERRMLWTTFPNLNKWFDGTKACLIHYGYVEDKPQLVVDIFKGREMPCEIDGKCA